MNKSLILITENDAKCILDDRYGQVLKIVSDIYRAHAEGNTLLPYSTFLHFPNKKSERIIGLPAYVGGDNPVAGFKWVASFPGNIASGLPRASAILALNDTQTGRVYSILEASAINIARTAASAGVVASLTASDSDSVAVVGCGPINLAMCSYLAHLLPHLKAVHIYDPDHKRALNFSHEIKNLELRAQVHNDLKTACKHAKLVSIATSASSPYIDDPNLFLPKTTILHISLRDISPDIIKDSVNIVDDIGHVNREQTSIHMASQELGNTDFIHATIGNLLKDKFTPPTTKLPLTIFSPFGLGILDVAVGDYVYRQAKEQGIGHDIPDFFS